MKKVFKVFIFIAGFFCVVFLVQNAMATSPNIYSTVEIKFLKWGASLPVFVLVAAGIFVGVVVGFIYEHSKVSFAKEEIKTLEAENRGLKSELSKLRNIPIEE